MEMTLRVWIEPHLGDRALDKIRPDTDEHHEHRYIGSDRLATVASSPAAITG
jgi:hypothetical protein